MTEFDREMLNRYPGCDGGNPGSPDSPSIWLFGIEPGYSKADEKLFGEPKLGASWGYPIAQQKTWRFNQNAFKLLSVVNGGRSQDWRAFADEFLPFEMGSTSPYFKGNLFPYPCPSLDLWPEKWAGGEYSSKADYRRDQREKRWPAINLWVKECRPKLIIGTGLSYSRDFSIAFLGAAVGLLEHRLSAAAGSRRVHYQSVEGTTLVVVPHLSRPLSSYQAIQETGAFIRAQLGEQP